jgi:hypothetical protein
VNSSEDTEVSFVVVNNRKQSIDQGQQPSTAKSSISSQSTGNECEYNEWKAEIPFGNVSHFYLFIDLNDIQFNILTILLEHIKLLKCTQILILFILVK